MGLYPDIEPYDEPYSEHDCHHMVLPEDATANRGRGKNGPDPRRPE